MRTRVVIAATALSLLSVTFAPTSSAGATVPPAPVADTIPASDSVPDEQGNLGVVVQTTIALNPSAETTIPAGCAIPVVPQMVFVGTLLSIQDSSATFRVVALRAGTAGGYINSDIVEVRYGRDTKFLDVGTRYIVGAASDAFSPLLFSKVRENAPMFGGDAVVGVNGSTGTCPRLEDPVRTIFENGTNIDTGILSPLLDNKLLVAFSVLLAIAFVVAALFLIVLMTRVSRRPRKKRD